MITLGIETSGRQGSVALVRDGALTGERNLSREGRRHARTLMAEIRELIRAAGIGPQDVTTIAVSIGPGSFTGLRVGVTCAKTWAYATGANVVAVDTLLAIATQSLLPADEVHVISDAQRGDLFVGRFLLTGRDWQRRTEIEIVPVKQWIESLDDETVVTGPAVELLIDRLSGRCRAESSERWYPQAASIAHIGECFAQRDQYQDLWQLEPVYVRKSAAEENL